MFNTKLDKLVEGKFGPGMPPLSELEKRTAIAFVSTNPVFDYPAPLPENVIPIAGLHIRHPKPLPKVRVVFRILIFKVTVWMIFILNFPPGPRKIYRIE